MKKILLILAIFSIQCSTILSRPNWAHIAILSTNNKESDESKPDSNIPKFAKSINLLKSRELAERLETKYPDQIPAAVIAWFKNAQSYDMLEQCIGRQLTQTGHDTMRKRIYTGSIIKPSAIVLTISGKNTLEDTIQALKEKGFAHNFIIDTNGDIHTVTNEHETVEQALTHRAYAVGVSGRVIDGCQEERDMNSAAITISVVGTNDEQPLTEVQNQAIVNLVTFLQKTYSIGIDQTLDYGCVACHEDGSYGRREPNPALPWQTIAIYPKKEHVLNTRIDFKDETAKTIWTALALRKIGYICPITHNSDHEHLKKALMVFQKHTKTTTQQGTIDDETIAKLNSMIIQHEGCNPKLQEIEPPALPLVKPNDPLRD